MNDCSFILVKTFYTKRGKNMLKINELVLKKPIITLIILFAITTFFGYQIYDKARIETNLEEYMPENHPAFVKSDRYEDIFAINDSVVVAVENSNSIYNFATLKQIKEIGNRLAELEEINKGEIKSLAKADNIEGSDLGLEIQPFFNKIPEEQTELKNLKNQVQDNNMVSGRLVAENHKVALIRAELAEGGADRIKLYNKIQRLVNNVEGPGKVYI